MMQDTSPEPVKADIVDQSIDALGRPLPWFLKAEELYGLCRRALAYAHTVPYAETAVTTLEGLTEAILDKTAVLTAEEGHSSLEKLDELLSTTLSTADEQVDFGRQKVINSMRRLKSAVHATLAQQVEKVTAATKGMQTQVSASVVYAQDRVASVIKSYEELYPQVSQTSADVLNKTQEVAAEFYHNPSGAVSTVYTMGTGYASFAQETIQGTYNNALSQAHATVDTVYTNTQTTMTTYVNRAQETLKGTYETTLAQVQGTASAVGPYIAGVPVVGRVVSPLVERVVSMLGTPDESESTGTDPCCDAASCVHTAKESAE